VAQYVGGQAVGGGFVPGVDFRQGVEGGIEGLAAGQDGIEKVESGFAGGVSHAGRCTMNHP
jgi:hypothetical protein